MQNFFTRHAEATWPTQQRLHVYLRANEELRGVVRRYQQQLQDSGVATAHGLGLQDREFLHFTVQMFTLYLRDVPEAAVESLVSRLTSALAQHKAFQLRVGPPQPSVHACELWISPETDDQWTQLVRTVRTATADILGPNALPPEGPNLTPHTSIGYGVGPGDSGEIMSTLKAVEPRPTLVEVPVTELELVAVTQHPSEGRFTWDTLATLPIGA